MLGGGWGVCLYRSVGTGASLNCTSSGLMMLVHSECKVSQLCPVLGHLVRLVQHHKIDQWLQDPGSFLVYLGWSERNSWRLSWDKGSAFVLLEPLMWVANGWNLDLMKARHLAKCMVSWSLEDPWLTMWTTAMLLQCTNTVVPRHFLPHRAPTITTSTSSFAVMW